MPNVITRKIANELSAPSRTRVDVYNRRTKNFGHTQQQHRRILKTSTHEEEQVLAPTEEFSPRKRCQCLGDCTCLLGRIYGETQIGEEPQPRFQTEEDPERCKEEKYVPGDLTEDHQKLDTFPALEEELCAEKLEVSERKAFPPYKTYISAQPEVNETLDDPPKDMKEDEVFTPFQKIIIDRENNTQPAEQVITHKIQDTTDFLVDNEQVNPTQLDDGIKGSSSKIYSPHPSRNTSSTSKSKSSKNTMSYCQEHEMYKRHPREVKSYVDTMINFELARELHKVNLEHEPLPDTVPKEFFVQLEKRQVPPIREKSATAIGWKGYKGFGATRCTKMKVFRPKTSPEMRKFEERQDSICSFDKKWRFIRQNKVNPMDLAICWDLTPDNPADEPRKTKHIDGSNGSIAPAVFSMVETPKDSQANERNEPTSGRNPPAVFAAVQQQADITKIGECYHARPHTSKSNTNLHTNCPKCLENTHEHMKRSQSAYNLNNKQHFTCDNHNQHLNSHSNEVYYKKQQKSNNKKHSKSSSSNTCQKLCCSGKIFNQRLCVACELKSVPEKEEKPKEHFKQAFKAGIPNVNSKASSGSSHSSQMHIKVPKQIIPYTKKNYAIRSLSAPFSLNKVREREDYPEHWRLASVYQHSYKPIHLRKKSLLASIFQ